MELDVNLLMERKIWLCFLSKILRKKHSASLSGRKDFAHMGRGVSSDTHVWGGRPKPHY